jgi:hypothetical protein
MGTIFIEWVDIQELISDTGQQVELSNGQRFYGPLDKPENQDMLMVQTEQGTVGVGVDDVIAMYPVEAGFWDRLDVMANVGFSWDKGSNVGKYTVGVDTEYRSQRYIRRASLNTELTTQSDKDDTSRASLDMSHMGFRPNRRFNTVFGNLEKNDELGIELRTLLGVGYGMFPFRDQNKLLALGFGLDVNREIPTNGEAQTNLEAVGSLNFDYYRYSTPERRFRVDFTVFPSLTDFGRVRANLDTTFKLEFIKDLFWNMTFYTAYDSGPIDQQASSIDYGVNSSVGYKF